MSDRQEINSFLHKPRSITRQSFILKGITTSSSTCDRKVDLNRLLELLNTTNDTTLQLKVFSALSAYLMFNKGANIDVIIKCNAVYDKIHSVLSSGLPRKCTDALNFLSALLYIDAEDGATKRALAIYARNMTRVSGCLAAMCEMFTECMLYHDTWKYLCQCLAVACSECEMNQSYCSHLVPVCVQKCSQVNIDILVVLQSLMLNHSKNNQLFLDCNGFNIFTRELLHYDKCLQLLTTVVQNSKISLAIIQKTNVLANLRDFLRLYGPNSQLGHKAIIILNHVSSNAKGSEPRRNTMATETEMHVNQSLSEIDAKKPPLPNANTENNFEETKVLIQNVMKEIYNWKQSELQNLKKTESKSVLDTINRRRIPSTARSQKFACKSKQLRNKTSTFTEKNTNEVKKLMEAGNKKAFQSNIARELSFSFLDNEDFQIPTQKDTDNFFKMPKNNTQQLNIDDTQLNNTTFYNTISNMMKNEKHTTFQTFSPVFASTPKQITGGNFTEATVHFNKTSEAQAKQNKFKNLKKKRQSAKKQLQKKNDIKNRSLGARFFGAINESCTTFVKTVKNIFNKKESSTVLEGSRSSSANLTENTVVRDKRPNTYSFINYMKKRDAVLNNNWMKNKITDRSELSTVANSCKTCDDTELLKHKLTKDEFLKQTVKKLKMGINLYGCDFKKISKTMWPRETYMTPLVLYNLYRKLLLK